MTIYSIVLTIVSLIWAAYEIWLVLKDRKQGKGHTGIDRGSRFLNFAAIILGIGGAALINGFSSFTFPGGKTATVFWIGIMIILLGFALRVWAVTTLGASFRTTVEINVNQKVIKNGPYKLIRHPSYTGLLMFCLGYGIAVQNWLSLIVAVVLPLSALIYRMQVEEKALVASLGSDYETYLRNTKKLIPWVW
jgi:protein-S-isoprenylcysteine O-methyltransferase Ste14